jgi:hypothetical protein
VIFATVACTWTGWGTLASVARACNACKAYNATCVCALCGARRGRPFFQVAVCPSGARTPSSFPWPGPTAMAISQLRIQCGTWNVNGKPCKEDLSPWLRVPAEDGTVRKHDVLQALGGSRTHTRSTGPSPDLVVVGLQEEDLRPEAYLHIDESRLNGWRAGIESVLTAMGDYVEVRKPLAQRPVSIRAYAPRRALRPVHACTPNTPIRAYPCAHCAVAHLSRIGRMSAQVACCQLVGMVILVYSTRLLCAHISDVDTAMVGCGYGGVMGNKVRSDA